MFFLFQNYDHLFKVNDKSVGGSFYLQSKVNTPSVLMSFSIIQLNKTIHFLL